MPPAGDRRLVALAQGRHHDREPYRGAQQRDERRRERDIDRGEGLPVGRGSGESHGRLEHGGLGEQHEPDGDPSAAISRLMRQQRRGEVLVRLDPGGIGTGQFSSTAHTPAEDC